MRRRSDAIRLLLAAIAMLPLCAAAAQAPRAGLKPATPGFAALAGVVDDSLRGGPLVGATVSVLGTALRATTDQSGVFRIDSITPGEVQVRVRHPLLDTMLVTVTTAKFTVVADRLDQIALATPPIATMRTRLCTRGGARVGDAMLIGRVDDADAGTPLANAAVSLVYTDSNPAGGATKRVRTARSDAEGLYVICGLPESLDGSVQATHGKSASGEIAVVTHAKVLETASFLLGNTVVTDSGATGSAILNGRVVDVTGHPIEGAQVAVEGGSAIVRTAVDGTFTIRNLPSGTTNASVRKIGYAQALRAVHLRKSAPESITVALSAGTRALATVTVTAQAADALDRLGFNDRLKMGNRSNFLFPEQLAKRQDVARLTDVFRTMPGFIVQMQGNSQIVASSRAVNGGQQGCVNVFVDRIAFEQMSPGDLDAAYPLYTIGAIESYPSTATTPADFRMPGRNCATIVLWTKLRLNKY